MRSLVFYLFIFRQWHRRKYIGIIVIIIVIIVILVVKDVRSCGYNIYAPAGRRKCLLRQTGFHVSPSDENEMYRIGIRKKKYKNNITKSKSCTCIIIHYVYRGNVCKLSILTRTRAMIISQTFRTDAHTFPAANGTYYSNEDGSCLSFHLGTAGRAS